MTTRKILSICLLVASVFVVRVSLGDTVTLNDGTETEGEIVREVAKTLTLRVNMGAMTGTIEISRSDIKAIKVGNVKIDPAIAQGKIIEKEASIVKDVPKAIEAWLKVGEFYDLHPGFSASAHAAFERVILLDPDNAKAREKLGFIKTAAGWTSRDEIRRTEAAKEQEASIAKVLAPQAAQETGPEDITIELKRDNDLVKRLKDQHAELVQGIAELDQRPIPPQQPIGVDEFTDVQYCPSILYSGGLTYGGFFGNYGYSNYSSYYGGFSGQSWGFHGRIGASRFSGRIGF